MSVISKATAYLAQFVSLLFGTTAKAANAGAKALASAKEAVEGYGSALKAANRQVAGFDQLNDMTEDSNDTGSSGGAGASIVPVNIADVKLGDWSEKVMESIRNGDWSQVGTLLGEKVNESIAKVKWNNIGDKIGQGIQSALEFTYSFLSTINFDRIGDGVANLLNSGMDKIDGSLLGKTLAKKWTTAVDFTYGFVTTFNWSQFGLKISQAVNGWFSEIDWSKAGQTVSDGIRGLFTSLQTFLSNLDWKAIGSSVKEFLVNIDWAGIFTDLASTIGTAIGGIALAIWGFIEEAWQSVVDWWYEKAFEDGKFTVGGLLSGILEAIKSIGTWIKENIFMPFINGFKSVFGISSPSTVMEEQGSFIIDGLWQGIKNAWTAIKTFFSEKLIAIKSYFNDLWTWLKEKFTSIGTNIKNAFSNAWAAIKNVWGTVKAWFNNTVIAPITGFFSGLWNGLKTGASNAWNGIKGIWTIVSTWFNNTIVTPVKNVFSGLWNGLKTGANNAWSGIKGVFNSVVTFFKDTFTKAWTAVKNVFSVGGKIFDGIKDGIVTAFKSIVNAIITGINKVVSVPFDGINWALDKIKGVSIMGFKPFNWINPINVPKIPMLADGGVLKQPTLNIAGEYPGARSNPEIVSPQNIMADTFRAVLKEFLEAFANNQQPSEQSINLVIDIGGVRFLEKLIKLVKNHERMTGKAVFG